jgi:16S rRNA (guanine527-N7)-methyltransferase
LFSVTLLAIKEIKRTLSEYGFVATTEYCERVLQYTELLLLWNRRVSLTTVIEPLEVLKFHFGESLMGMKTGCIEHGRLADVGSGAGFPGMPIAMANPRLQTRLIESNAKKATFLAEVTRKLGLGNVQIYKGRAKDLSAPEKFDFVTARALGRHHELLRWAGERLDQGGKAIFWLSSEGVKAIRGCEGWVWGEPLQIPETKDRFVVAGARLK